MCQYQTDTGIVETVRQPVLRGIDAYVGVGGGRF